MKDYQVTHDGSLDEENIQRFSNNTQKHPKRNPYSNKEDMIFGIFTTTSDANEFHDHSLLANERAG
jgi:hypothetical protein